MYVQYGCGFSAPPEWVNFDASNTLKWERMPLVGLIYTKNKQRFPPNVRCGDIVRGLPVEDHSCRGVYASHVLEHLALEDFHTALANTRRMLQARGVFRLIVPDLEWIAREYVNRLNAGDRLACHFFLSETCLGRSKRPRGLGGFLYEWLRTSAHQWMWDAPALEGALREHGFTDVRRCAYQDAEDRMFDLVEDQDRFKNAVAMEARV